MSVPLSPQQSALLALIPRDGSSIGNTMLREQLGWDEATYATVRDELVAAGILEKGKGRGGSVRRAGGASPQPAAPAIPLIDSVGSQANRMELFAPEEVESVVPELERARRAAAALQPKAKTSTSSASPVTEHRYTAATRKNLPAAGDALGHVEEAAQITYAYDPHRAPVLRFNEAITRQRALLDEARRRPLTAAETEELAALLEAPQPWLEWAGKREQPDFSVEPVALHIHERVSAQAILRAVRREDIQRDLFAEGVQSAREARAYYQHDVAWANRLITGDSLQVMTSLARREGLAGQVQMIYFDPPYGIKFSSNWQNEVGKREVGDKDADISREPEMIRAYRDTWTLGVHSYLAYLKQRLVLARELLTDSGSIFLQISDENLHRVRAMMDEVFGPECHVVTMLIKKKGSQKSSMIDPVNEYIIWFGKSPRESGQIKFNRLYERRAIDEESVSEFRWVELSNGSQQPLNSIKSPAGEDRNYFEYPERLLSDYPGARFFRAWPVTNGGFRATQVDPIEFQGRKFNPPENRCWSFRSKRENDADLPPMLRLREAARVCALGNSIDGIRYLDDFAAKTLTNWWDGLGGAANPVYVVQTNPKIIQRCMLMCTDPGDLVLDPTCGSGTSAFVAEQWGRRWITIDSSRVAIAIARQRLLTASFDTYKTKDPAAGIDPGAPQNPSYGFHYETIPYVTLKSIAQNQGLDAIFAKHEPILVARLKELNTVLAGLGASQATALQQKLVAKLLGKHVADGANSITDADQRRWLLPSIDPKLIVAGKKITPKQVEAYRAAIPPTGTWRDWEVPFDIDPDWPAPLAAALTAYRTAWRAKMDEVNAAIAANAEQEELVDQPEAVRGVARVAGPFTVESVRPPETSLKGEAEETGPIGGAPGELETFEDTAAPERDVAQAASHIERMLGLLKHDGLTFLGNKHAKFAQLDAIESSFLHAEGEFQAEDGKPHRVAVVIGPEFGSVTSFQVDNALRAAHRRGYDDLVFAGFSFDATAQETVQAYNDEPRAEVRIHLAQIRPDVSMKDLLKKTQKVEQIFTVFGQPRTRVTGRAEGLVVHMDGVDVYDPVQNALQATTAGKVAAWFLDTDYDGKVFCICQAFFPDKSAWEKLSRALKASVTEGAFEALTGTTSLPFKPGPRQCVAVKVIDPRGNEVMRVHRLDGKYLEGEE
ncbi:MAG: site-specific DNA-methyltransferase [Opitutaceae bacterium]|nr:site-specific DNA-methyltransferase [Opitutaceae bacterium]